MAKDKKSKTSSASTLDDLLRNIEKDFGSGAIAQGRGSIVNVKSFPTNVPALDYVLGIGGIPIGRIIELYGRESGGKTTTTLQIIKACQNHYFEDKKRNGVCAFIDAEHAFDPLWAQRIGVDLDKLLLSQPDSGEKAFEIIERLVSSKLIDLIVVDSAAALTPEAILEGEMTDSTIGEQARMMSKGLSKIKHICNESETTVIFINQIREKIGVMFGNPEQTPGGRALKFYSSVRIEINKVTALKESDVVYGFRTRAKTVKNKTAAPFLEHEFDICVGKPPRNIYGIDETYSLVELGLEMGTLIRKGNNQILFLDTAIAVGKNAAVEAIKADAKLRKVISEETYKLMFGDLEKRINHEIELEADGLEDGILDAD